MNIIGHIFTFSSIKTLVITSLFLAVVYFFISLILLLGMVIRRKSMKWRDETIQDILKFKFFSITYGISSIISIIFLPYIAVPMWIGCYKLLEKKFCHQDMIAMMHFCQRPSYDEHPMRALTVYQKQIKTQRITDNENGTYIWALRIYTYLTWVTAIPFMFTLLFESSRIIHAVPCIININIAIICLFVPFYILICWGHNAANNGSVLMPILAFAALMVILNVVFIGYLF